MSKNLTTTTLLERRTFLKPGVSLDAVSVELAEERWDPESEDVHYTAGLNLTEEGQGHYCIHAVYEADLEDLQILRDAVATIGDHCGQLVAALDRVLSKEGGQ